MKVVLCASAYPPDIRGGGEISTALIAAGLASCGVDVTVLTFTHRDGQEERCQVDGVDLWRLPCPNVYWSLDAEGRSRFAKACWHFSQATRRTPPGSVCEAIESLRPDLVHSSTIEDFGPGLWRWAASRRWKVAHTLRSFCLRHHHGTMYDHVTDGMIGNDRLAVARRYFSQSVNGVIGISNDVLIRHLEDGFFRRAEQTVIPNPIDAPIAEVASPASATVRLGVLGRITPEKGVGQLIDALATLPRHGEASEGLDHALPPWSLEIAGVGDSGYVESLRSKSAGLPVEFVGWRVSREFLSELDLLIVPSRWQEPFGRIVVEAYSIGLPVLCLRRGGLPELVRDGTTGWVLDEWDDDALGRAIGECRTLDRTAIRQCAAEYTVEKIASRHLEFYKQIMGQGRSSR